jgi:hypothetical protein
MLPSPVISRGRRSQGRPDTLIAVLLTLLGAAVIAVAILASVIQKKNETIDALREKVVGMSASHPLAYFASHGGNLPLATAVRRSPVSSGYILLLTNESTESLPLVVGLRNASGAVKTAHVVIDAEQTGEFSHFDDWRLASGDTAEISHEGFNSVTMRLR